MLVTNPQAAMILPDPPSPPTDPTPERIAQWERDMAHWRMLADAERIAASDRHGAAQQATADAMQRHADKQQALIDAMNAPAAFDPVSTAVKVAAELAAHTPMTPDQIAKRARDVALQLGQEFPA